MPNRFGFNGQPQGLLIPIAATSSYLAVTTSAANLAAALSATGTYVYTANVDTFIKQGAAPTASAGAASMFVPAGMPVLIDGAQGAVVSVIGLAAGHATLQTVKAIIS